MHRAIRQNWQDRKVTTGLLAVLYTVVLATAFAASRVRPLSTRIRTRWPRATTITMIIVGLPALVQFTAARWILDNLERNWTLVQRQVWRLFTSMVVQDGGLAGAIDRIRAAVTTAGHVAQL